MLLFFSPPPTSLLNRLIDWSYVIYFRLLCFRLLQPNPDVRFVTHFLFNVSCRVLKCEKCACNIHSHDFGKFPSNIGHDKNKVLGLDSQFKDDMMTGNSPCPQCKESKHQHCQHLDPNTNRKDENNCREMNYRKVCQVR